MPNIPVFVKFPLRPIQNLFRIRSFFFVSWSLLKKLKAFSVFYYSFVVLKSLLLEYCFTCFNYKKKKGDFLPVVCSNRLQNSRVFFLKIGLV